MKLEIVILTLDADALTMRCLSSLSQTLVDNPDYGVVLVDNGSVSGDIFAWIKDARFSWSDRLKLIRLPENKGVAGGRNVGMEAARNAEYIMLLDNDTIVSPGAIESMVAFMDSRPDIGLAAPRLVSPEGSVQINYKPFPGIGEKLKNLFGRKNEIAASEAGDAVSFPFYVIGACQIIRGSVAREIGRLDDRIFFGPEDADYCMRVRNAGYKVAYVPYVEIIHDWQRSSRKSLFSPVSRAHIRGLLYFYRKWRRVF